MCNRIKYKASALMLLFVLFAACGKPDDKQTNNTFQYASYRDIPGVTEEEVKAIEALRKQRDSFVYGVNPTTEAFYDSDGQIKGYAALFCKWLTEFLGIPFKPVIYEWGDLITGLETKNIDFTGELKATDERRKTYFMTSTIVPRTLKTFRIEGSKPLSEIAALRPLRYAFLGGSTTIDDVTKLFYNEYEVLQVYDNYSAYELLKSGEADAFIEDGPTEAALDVYGDVVAADFFPLVISPVSLTTQNPALEPVISVMQKALDNGALGYLVELYNIGYQEYKTNKLFMQLSKEEIAYIKDNPIVPFAAGNGNYPVSFYNKHEQEWQGISFDILKEVEYLSGLRFELAHDQKTLWRNALSMLESGEVAMISGIIRSNARQNVFLWADTPVMTDYYALISKSDYHDINLNEVAYAKIGTITGTSYAEVFSRWFPDHKNIAAYQDTDSAIDALESGEVDMLMANEGHLLLIANYRELTGYKINIVFDYTFDSGFGFNKNEAILCSIVDKALRLINTNRISDQWTRRTYDYRIKVVEARRPWLIGSSVLLLTVFALFTVLFVKTRRVGRKLERQSEAVLAASGAKSIFLATMSHEIRTPLNAIIGMTAIGKKSTEMEVKNYTLSKIDDASTHLLGVINDILDMSKIEANKLELSAVEFNFERMLQKVITVINFRMAEKRQKFSVNMDGKVPRLLISDDQRLAQVITNLLSNAAKFTPVEGEISLTVSLLSKEDGVCEIKIEVADNGIGISAEQKEKLFSAFGQAKSGISREFGGTGLGLSISKRIVEMMDGRIWVESEIGRGARFIFTIKVLYSEENLRSQLAPGVQWDKIRVLAVDDLLLTRQYFSDIFSRLGIHCETVENGFDACKIIEERGGFDIYFIDWRLPGMDGLGLIKWIKSKEIPGKTVLISFAELEEIREASLRSGADKCLVMPLLSSTIVDFLNECFEISGKNEGREQDNEFEGKTLLIVEDIDINREILLSLLEHTGLNIECAVNGEEAIALIGAAPEKYDAVFMDMQMPVMDGLEATRLIRAMSAPQCAKLPIIAMTANVFKDDIERCIAAGMNDHIGKPVDIEEMFGKLRKVL